MTEEVADLFKRLTVQEETALETVRANFRHARETGHEVTEMVVVFASLPSEDIEMVLTHENAIKDLPEEDKPASIATMEKVSVEALPVALMQEDVANSLMNGVLLVRSGGPGEVCEPGEVTEMEKAMSEKRKRTLN